MHKLGTTEKLVLHLLPKKQWMATKDMVALLAKIGTSESAVRATLFRLRRKHLIKDSRRGRETLFALADAGEAMFAAYKARMLRAEEPWKGKWLLLSFHVPEKKRPLRNILRDELRSLGFGRLHTNLWVSPYDLREECTRLLDRLRAHHYTVLFITDSVEMDPRALASRAWNLARLSTLYQRLVPRYRKECAEFKRSHFADPSQCAAEALVRLLKLKEEIVTLSGDYPHLPKELLPDRWVGIQLKQVVVEYLQLLYEKASPLLGFDYATGKQSVRCGHP